MSIEALRWALEVGEQRNLEPTTRHILLILGNRADEQGYLYPSITWISRRTGLANSTIREHMKALEQAGIITRHKRHAESGGRTSDDIQLAMEQLGLPLTPPADYRRAPSDSRRPPPPPDTGTPPPPAGAYTQELKQEKKKPLPKGAKAPSAVARLWAIYSQGVKAKHNGEPAPSARANGMLSQIVARIGGDPAKAVVEYYLNHRDPWYARQLHDLRWLVRDCEKLWLELQRQTGGSATLPQKSAVYLVLANDQASWLEDQPVGDPLEIAKRARNNYARMIAMRKAKGIKVRIGDRVSTYTIEELRT